STNESRVIVQLGKGKGTWEGRVVAFGTVPVCCRCTGRLNGGGLVLAGKAVKLLLGLVKLGKGKGTWEGRVVAFGTVPVCCRCTGRLNGGGLVLAGKAVKLLLSYCPVSW
nr:hypothetical protein [Tanacetum cinerariifolium]